MAAKIRQLTRFSAWILLAFLALLPVIGLVVGMWPNQRVNWTDINSFLAYQGLAESIAITLFSAIFSTLLSFYIAFVLYSQYHQSKGQQAFEKYLAPLLALPHLAIAIGLVFLFSAGGAFFADVGLPRKGVSTLILAIVVKEVPFFLLILTALGRQLPISQWLLQAKALGYASASGWWLVVLPKLLSQARLALIAATAYTLSVVDVSLLVGPNIPELLAVSVYRWQSSFAAGDQALAFYSNLMLILLLSVAVAVIYVHERLIKGVLLDLTVRGKDCKFAKLSALFNVWLPASGLVIILIIGSFLLWSLGFNQHGQTTGLAQLSLDLWKAEWLFFALPLQNSLLIGIGAAVLGVACALLALELQRQQQYYLPDYFWLLAIILPQLSMVLGWQLLHIGLDGSFSSLWVVLAHLPFTFAYAYLVLKGPFQHIQPNYQLIAASFGYSPWKSWWQVRFRLLLPAIYTALAIAFSVSIAQYIPTLLLGAGRVSTITTEAVAIGTGSQQNLMALYMLLQSLMPFVAFVIAIVLGQQIRGVSGESNVKA